MCVYALCRACGSRELRFVVLCFTRSSAADGNGDARAVKGRVLRNRRGGKDKDGGYGQAYSRHKTAQRTLPHHAARCSFHLLTSLNVALTWYCLPLSPPAPHINYTLNDDEIMTDLSLMKKRELPPSGTSLYLWF